MTVDLTPWLADVPERSAAAIGDARNALIAPHENPDADTPGTALGGVTGIEAGMSEYFTADFAKSTYALICFLPDATDGKPHFAHGMVKTFTVGARTASGVAGER